MEFRNIAEQDNNWLNKNTGLRIAAFENSGDAETILEYAKRLEIASHSSISMIQRRDKDIHEAKKKNLDLQRQLSNVNWQSFLDLQEKDSRILELEDQVKESNQQSS